MTSGLRTVRTTCPRDCYDACGITVKLDGDAVERVLGDPRHPVSHGWLCGKCAVGYNGGWRDPGRRLLRPLRRVGPKGQGRFETISWAEALATVASSLRPILDTAGGEAVLQTHYTGTCSLIAGNAPLRFFNRIGAVEVDPDTVCNKAGHAALGLAFGDSLQGFDPRTIQDSRCVIVWGANPSACAPHVDRHWLHDARVTTIVIDPIRHPTAARATLHLQPFPGTDAALAFALLHVIAREGRLDRAFLDAHTIGWAEAEPHVAAATPEWAEGLTGVPAALIVTAARHYAAGPSLLWLGQGLQRQRFGGNVMRACSLLPVATGMIGKPGAGVLYLNGFGGRGIDGDYLTGAHLCQGEPRSISHMDLAARLEDASASRALFTWNNNIAASSPEQARLRAALRREDLFHVALELFHTDTVDHADIVLPAASFLEFDDLVLSYFHLTVSAQVKVMAPLGEALPNQEIFRRLAGALDLTDAALHEDDATMIATLLGQTGIGETFASLAAKGTVDWAPEPVMQFADLRFNTPSGRIEIASERYVAAGLTREPRPSWEARPPAGMLRLLSPASEWLMNSTFANEPRVGQALGARAALLHPDDAAARGLAEGAHARLWNATGQLTVPVGISQDVPRGVILAPKGRWPKLEPEGANVNALNPGDKTDIAESAAVHSILVHVELAGAPAAAAATGAALSGRR